MSAPISVGAAGSRRVRAVTLQAPWIEYRDAAAARAAQTVEYRRLCRA